MKKEILSLKIRSTGSIREILLYVDTIEGTYLLTDPDKDEGLTFGAIQIFKRIRCYKSQYVYPYCCEIKFNPIHRLDNIFCFMFDKINFLFYNQA